MAVAIHIEIDFAFAPQQHYPIGGGGDVFSRIEATSQYIGRPKINGGPGAAITVGGVRAAAIVKSLTVFPGETQIGLGQINRDQRLDGQSKRIAKKAAIGLHETVGADLGQPGLPIGVHGQDILQPHRPCVHPGRDNRSAPIPKLNGDTAGPLVAIVAFVDPVGRPTELQKEILAVGVGRAERTIRLGFRLGHPTAIKLQQGQQNPRADAILAGYPLDHLRPAQFNPIHPLRIGRQVTLLLGHKGSHIKINVSRAVDHLAIGQKGHNRAGARNL